MSQAIWARKFIAILIKKQIFYFALTWIQKVIWQRADTLSLIELTFIIF